MEAKNTVMGAKEITRIVEMAIPPRDSYRNALVRTQAEISFPLGKQEGIREVMKWIKSNSFHSNSAAFHKAAEEGQVNCFNDRELQEYLKNGE